MSSSRASVRRLALAAFLLAASTPAAAQVAQSSAAASVATGYQVPLWAFPHSAGAAPTQHASATPRRLPHSAAAFTDAQLQDRFFVADWYPDAHPPMPPVVAHGRKPAVNACAYCHLADGIGRPENAMLAGLPAAYIVEQIEDLRARERQSALASFAPGASMRHIADSTTAAEAAQAAAYFSRLPARPRSRVVESTSVPRTVPWDGLSFRVPEGGEEALGIRLVEIAEDREAHELHDPYATYVAYVPPGSVARGRALATHGREGGVPACESCHGPGLRGVGVVPPLAGRSPSYLLRQLIAFRTGARSSAAGAPMRAVAATLDTDDMLAAAAYAATLQP